MSLGVLLNVFKDDLAVRRVELGRNGKIAVCHVASGDLWAGAEAQIAALLGALGRRTELRLTVLLLNEGRLAEEVRRLGIELKVISEGQKSFLQIVREAAEYLRGQNIHVLHSHRYKENLLSALLAWRCNVPFLVRSQHGLPEPFQGMKRVKQGLLAQLDRVLARFATDRVISVSEELQQHLVRHLSARKVVVIPNGVDTSQVRSYLTNREAKMQLGIPEDCWVLGVASRLEPIKRIDIFLNSAKEILRIMPNTRFVIAGEGREKVRLQQLASAMGLGNRVLFFGHREDVYDVLRAFDILVLCSDHEGLPMVLLEAMYLGIPVVARRVGGIAHTVENGVDGVLVDSNDPRVLAEECVGLLADNERRIRLAQAGIRSVAEKFSATRTANEVVPLYESLCRSL